MKFHKWLEALAQEIELAGKIEQETHRILQGRCVLCGLKLPVNSSSYRCQPDCESHFADPCKGVCVYCGVSTTNKDVYGNFCCPSCEVTLS